MIELGPSYEVEMIFEVSRIGPAGAFISLFVQYRDLTLPAFYPIPPVALKF